MEYLVTLIKSIWSMCPEVSLLIFFWWPVETIHYHCIKTYLTFHAHYCFIKWEAPILGIYIKLLYILDESFPLLLCNGLIYLFWLILFEVHFLYSIRCVSLFGASICLIDCLPSFCSSHCECLQQWGVFLGDKGY